MLHSRPTQQCDDGLTAASSTAARGLIFSFGVCSAHCGSTTAGSAALAEPAQASKKTRFKDEAIDAVMHPLARSSPSTGPSASSSLSGPVLPLVHPLEQSPLQSSDSAAPSTTMPVTPHSCKQFNHLQHHRLPICQMMSWITHFLLEGLDGTLPYEDDADIGWNRSLYLDVKYQRRH